MKFIVLAFILFSHSCNFEKNSDFMEQRKKILSIALVELKKKYPDIPTDDKNWSVREEEKTWIVYPKASPEVLGGGPTAEIDRETLKVVNIYFSE